MALRAPFDQIYSQQAQELGRLMAEVGAECSGGKLS